MTPPQRTIYLSQDEAIIWDNLPDGMRSELLRNILIEYEFEGIDNKTEEEKNEEMLRKKIIQIRQEFEKTDMQYGEIENKLDSIRVTKEALLEEYRDTFGKGFSEEIRKVVASDIWDVIISQADYHQKKGVIFRSPSGKNRYRIQNVKKGKIMVERMDTQSTKPSTFTIRTIEKAVNRLNKEGGIRIRKTHFMPVLAQEAAAIELHPRLSYQGEWVVYDGGEK